MASKTHYLKIISMFVGLVVWVSCLDQNTHDSHKPEITLTTAQEALPKMLRGINLGNTLEPDDEGDWNNGLAEEYYFDDYQSAGFTCVRVPVKWGSHTLEYPPYTVDPAWMAKVNEVISWGLERELFIILNAHHEGWIKEDYSDSNIARFEAIWSQIGDRFRNKSDQLFFEIINEPHGMTAEQVDDLNARILSIIRTDNPTRIVIYSGHEWSALDQMMSAAIPDDDYLMAYWHTYQPWSFAGEAQGTWGTPADLNDIASMFKQAGEWSAANNIPAMISEFGAVQACDYNSRMRHYACYVEEALRNNIPFQVWDDGGMFGIYEREDRAWPEVRDMLIYSHPDGPTDLTLTPVGHSTLKIGWRNRTTENDRIFIQRRTSEATFQEIAELGSLANEFEDTGRSAGVRYTYRILARMDTNMTYHSYPIQGGIQ